MGVEQTNDDSVRFRCDWCQRAADYWPSPYPFVSIEETVRAAGWRIGRPYGSPACYCPECVDTDRGYWSRRILAQAGQAGLS